MYICNDIHANLYLHVVTPLGQKFSIMKILYITLSGSAPV